MKTGRLLLAVAIAAAVALPLAGQSGRSPFVANFGPTELDFNPLIAYTTTEAQIFSGLYEGLLSYDPSSLDPIPGVASRWEISSDGTRYRFTLRPTASFSNGDPVLASDFRETWLLLLSPRTNAAYASLLDVIKGARAYRTGESEDPSSVGLRVVSDRVLEIELEQRATHFLRILAHHSFVPIHGSLRETFDFSDPTSIPVNGPYRVSSMTAELLVLERSRSYWDAARVAIPEIRIRFSDDFEEVTDAFNAGEIHWVRDGMDLGRVERHASIVVNALFATTYYQFSASGPLGDARVRRALALLLPWKEIRDEERMFVAAASLVPALPSYPEVSGFTEADAPTALSLLHEAGYPAGHGLDRIVISVPGGSENYRIAGHMKESWESALDVDVVIETIPHPRYFPFIEQGDFMVTTLTWVGDFADPLTFLDMWTTGSNLNNSGYSNLEFDALVRSALGQTGSDRYETLGQAERVLLHDAIVLPISHSAAVNLINLDLIAGWYPNPLDIHPFKHLAYASGRPLPNVALR